MKVVRIYFSRNGAGGKVLTNQADIICENDISDNEVISEYAGCTDFGWKVAGIKVIEQSVRTKRLD